MTGSNDLGIFFGFQGQLPLKANTYQSLRPNEMPKPRNKQRFDAPEKPLRPEESAHAIREKIQQRHIYEANQLLQELASDMDRNDWETLNNQLSVLVEQAENAFRGANGFAKERKLEEAREKFKEVETIAVDYPGLPEACKRVDEAMELVWALQQKANRRLSGQDKEPAALATTSKPGKSRSQRVLALCFVLMLIIVGAGLFHTVTGNLTFLKKSPVPHVAPPEDKEYSEVKEIAGLALEKTIEPTQKDVPVRESADKQQNLTAQPSGADQKERLPPAQVSSRQMDNETEDTEKNSPADTGTTRLNIQPTVDIARRPRETSLAQGLTEVVGQAPGHVTMTDASEPQPPIAEIGEQSDSAFAMSSRTSAEYLYTVQTGDTLGIISKKAYGTFTKWPAILNANKDQLENNPDKLEVGMTLVIPPLTKATTIQSQPDASSSLPTLNADGTYTVQFGDSLSTIAQKLFGKSEEWKTIYELNKDVLTESHKLEVGQILKVNIQEL